MFYELHVFIIDHLAHSSGYGYTTAHLEHLTSTLLDLLCNLQMGYDALLTADISQFTGHCNDF